MTNKDEWKTFYEEGARFYSIAYRGFEKNKFPPEMLFNLLGMAVEKLFMGLLLKHNTMPYNHTFADLIESMKEIKPVPCDLAESLLHMDSFQEICSVDDYLRKDLTRENIEEFLTVAGDLKQFIISELNEETPV